MIGDLKPGATQHLRAYCIEDAPHAIGYLQGVLKSDVRTYRYESGEYRPLG